MKASIITVIIVVFSTYTINAQSFFNCSYVEYWPWNYIKKEFEYKEGVDKTASFTINNTETGIDQVINSKRTFYTIKSKEFEDGIFTYNVKDPSGNSCIFYFEIKNKVIKLLSGDKDNVTTYLFHVAKYWTE